MQSLNEKTAAGYVVMPRAMKAKMANLSAPAYKLCDMIIDRSFRVKPGVWRTSMKWETVLKLANIKTKKTILSYFKEMKSQSIAIIKQGTSKIDFLFYTFSADIKEASSDFFLPEQRNLFPDSEKNFSGQNPVPASKFTGKPTNCNITNNSSIKVSINKKYTNTSNTVFVLLDCFTNKIWNHLNAIQGAKSPFLLTTLRFELEKYIKEQAFNATDLVNASFAVLEKRKVLKTPLALIRAMFSKKCSPLGYTAQPIKVDIDQAIENIKEAGNEQVKEFLYGQGFGTFFTDQEIDRLVKTICPAQAVNQPDIKEPSKIEKKDQLPKTPLAEILTIFPFIAAEDVCLTKDTFTLKANSEFRTMIYRQQEARLREMVPKILEIKFLVLE